MAIPAIAALHSSLSEARVDVWVGSHSRAVFEMCGCADRIIDIEDQPRLSSIPHIASALRRERYDVVAILDRSRALRLAGRMAGSDRAASATFRPDEERHESDVYRDVVRSLGIPAPPTLPRCSPPTTAREAAIARLRSFTEPMIVVHPGGAQNPGVDMLDKRWPEDRWVELTRHLAARFDVVLSGGHSDRATALRVAQQAGLPEWHVLAGEIDIAISAAVIERADLFVGIDTGMSHIAAAVGTPTVAIFGPTNPRRYRPLGPHVRVVAPAAAWSIRDVDLREHGSVDPLVSTRCVAVSDVVQACESLLRPGTRRA